MFVISELETRINYFNQPINSLHKVNGGKSQGKNVKYNKALNSHISVFLFLIFANYKPERAKSELSLCLLQ